MNAVYVVGVVMAACGVAGFIVAGLLCIFTAPYRSDRERHLALLGAVASAVAVAGGVLALDWVAVAASSATAVIWSAIWWSDHRAWRRQSAQPPGGAR